MFAIIPQSWGTAYFAEYFQFSDCLSAAACCAHPLFVSRSVPFLTYTGIYVPMHDHFAIINIVVKKSYRDRSDHMVIVLNRQTVRNNARVRVFAGISCL